MDNYAIQVLQQRVNEINTYIKIMESIDMVECRFLPDYNNLKQKRRHLQRVIVLIRVMDLDLNAI